MLADITAGRERSSVVCVEDTVNQAGGDVITCFVEGLLKRVDEVHLLCFDEPSSSLKSSARLQVHDGYSDTFGWLDSSSDLNVNTDIPDFIGRHSKVSANQKVAVVMNSLSPLLIQHGAVKTCQIVHRLTSLSLTGGEITQLIFLLHSDLHDDHSLSLIHHVTSTILKISPSKSSSHFAVCSTLHKKPSGKVVKTSEHFNISPSLEIVDVEEVKSSVVISTEHHGDQPDPTANLTFNLSLTDKEKEARSQLVLPYTAAMSKSNPESVNQIGQGEGGKIFYQPDDADDFDEEDPDDDLDI